MSEVALTIGGRTYKVACAPGEEAHVGRLGQAIDAKLASMPQLSPQEAQNLLFGALLLADELHDLRNANTAAQDDAESAREQVAPLTAEVERLTRQAGETAAQMAELRARAQEAGGHRQALEALRAEFEELRQAEADMGQELGAAQSAEAELRAQLAALEDERDALREKLESARNAPPPADAGALPGDADLGPALERFAELLESCADKLEGKPAAP